MKKIMMSLGVLLLFTLPLFHQNRESVNGLVLYESEVSSYDTLKKYLNEELDINLNVDYVIDDSETFEKSDFWEYSKTQLSKKLNDNKIDLLLDIPNEYLRDCIENEKLLKLDNSIDIHNIYPAIVDKSREVGNNSIYFISPYFSSNFIMINVQLFEELNIPVPNEIKSWQNVSEILSDVKSSIESNNIDNIYPLSLGINGIESFFQDFEVLTTPLNLSVKSGRTIYDDEKWIDVFSFFMNLYKEYGIHETINTPTMFVDDKIVMKFVQGSEITNYTNSMDKYKVFEVPSYKGFEDKVYINTVDISIPANAHNKENALKVLNHFLSKEFASTSVDGRLFGLYPFVSYIDDEILHKCSNFYNLNNPSILYPDKPGYANKHEFISFSDYVNYQQSQREVVPDIISGKISIEDGFNEIKKRYLKYSTK